MKEGRHLGMGKPKHQSNIDSKVSIEVLLEYSLQEGLAPAADLLKTRQNEGMAHRQEAIDTPKAR